MFDAFSIGRVEEREAEELKYGAAVDAAVGASRERDLRFPDADWWWQVETHGAVFSDFAGGAGMQIGCGVGTGVGRQEGSGSKAG